MNEKVFNLERFGTLGGEAQGKTSIRQFCYIASKKESIEDIKRPNYFISERHRLLLNDVIKVIVPNEYTRIKGETYIKHPNIYHTLRVIECSLSSVIVEEMEYLADLADAPEYPEEDTDQDIGEIGESKSGARADHKHPKTIATQEERGQVILSNNEEQEYNKDIEEVKDKVITNETIRTFFNNRKSTQEEIDNGEDIYKYTNPKQLYNERINNEYSTLTYIDPIYTLTLINNNNKVVFQKEIEIIEGHIIEEDKETGIIAISKKGDNNGR